MARSRTSPTSTAAHASQLAELLGAGDDDADAVAARKAAASRHFEQERRRKPRGARAGAEAEAGTRAEAEPGAGAAAAAEPGTRAGAGARAYLHDGPTRSPVLNAFLHELGGAPLVAPGVGVPEEHLLAPRLVELGRRRVATMLLAAGQIEAGALLAAHLKPIGSERSARIFLRQAARAGAQLGAIAGDYEAHRQRAGAEHGDRLAACIMAAFAGRLLALAAKLLGPHVRDEVRAELAQLTAAPVAPARRRRVSGPPAADGAEPLAAAPRGSRGAPRR